MQTDRKKFLSVAKSSYFDVVGVARLVRSDSDGIAIVTRIASIASQKGYRIVA